MTLSSGVTLCIIVTPSSLARRKRSNTYAWYRGWDVRHQSYIHDLYIFMPVRILLSALVTREAHHRLPVKHQCNQKGDTVVEIRNDHSLAIAYTQQYNIQQYNHTTTQIQMAIHL